MKLGRDMEHPPFLVLTRSHCSLLLTYPRLTGFSVIWHAPLRRPREWFAYLSVDWRDRPVLFRRFPGGI